MSDFAKGPRGERIPAEVKTARVTASHIRRGKRHDCEKCPIALAAAPLFPGRHVVVTGDYVFVYDTQTTARIAAEEWYHDGTDFIEAFDDNTTGNEAVEPREVTLTLRQRYA